MWVYRQPPQHRRVNRDALLTLLGSSAPRALAEMSMGCSAAGVCIASASAAMEVTLNQTGVKTATATASMSVAVTAAGIDANAPSASTSMTITASARGVKGASASASMSAQLETLSQFADLLLEPQFSSVAMDLDVSPVILASASVSMAVSAQAEGFQEAPVGADATATVQTTMTVTAEGRSTASASASVSMGCSAAGVIVQQARTDMVIDAQANAVFLGPAVRTANVLGSWTLRATGVRITAAETPKAPVGRVIDWQSVVGNAAAKVPDYEFGHRPQRRVFFQR